VRDRTETVDPRLVKALSHPLRVQILDVLSERIASPNWLSDRLDATLSHVAYHTRTLSQCGCLSLVDTAQKRGATEHFYKAAPGSYVSSRVWRRVPQAILGGVSGATLQSFMDRAVAALEAGTIDAREDTVLTWMPLLLDQRGWEEVVSIMEEATDRVLAAQQKSDQRVADADSPPQTISTIAGLASFEAGGSRPA
jgi:DNA-binding transcriptional ArsR family regulator